MLYFEVFIKVALALIFEYIIIITKEITQRLSSNEESIDRAGRSFDRTLHSKKYLRTNPED